MKQNRSTQIILGILVCAVWGTVVYRFLNLKNRSESNNEVNHAVGAPKPVSIAEKDTFTLALDYPDPFLGTSSDRPVQNKPIAHKSKGSMPSKPALPLPMPPSIFYRGYATDGSGKTLVRISVAGKSATIPVGTELNGVRLAETFQDSIRVFWNKRLLTIRRRP